MIPWPGVFPPEGTPVLEDLFAVVPRHRLERPARWPGVRPLPVDATTPHLDEEISA